MADGKSFADRRRERDKEEGKKEQMLSEYGFSTEEALKDYTDKLIELLGRAEPLMAQVNSMYQQFLNGTELKPPLERRRSLDQLINALSMMNKPTVAYQFKYQNIHDQYLAYKNKWDGIVNGIESGRIKRRILKK